MKQKYNLFNTRTYTHLKVSCVYKITTTYNNLCYIGSTLSFTKRMKDHRNLLKNDKHTAHYLQNVVNKYRDPVYAEILEYVNEKDLLNREKYYIDLYKPRYNTILDPTTQKNNNATSKKVYQYDLNGFFIKSWKSLSSVNRELNIQVFPALDKINRSAGHYQWRTFKLNKIKPYKAKQGVEKLIHVYTIWGKYKESLTLNDIHETYYQNLTIQQVRNRVNNQCNNSKSILKLRFSRIKINQLDNSINCTHKRNYIIIQYDKNMNYIEIYDTLENAQRTLKLTSIYDNLSGKTRLVNNQYIFKKLNGSHLQ